MAVFKLKGVGDFPFRRDRLSNLEAMLLEKVTGRRLVEIIDDFNTGPGPLGLTAYLWLAMRRNGHHVRYDTLEFDFGDLEYTREDETDNAPADTAAEEETPHPPRAATSGSAKPRSTPARKKAGSPTK